VLGVTVPLVVVALAAVGLFVVPRVLDNQQAASDSSATPSLSADPQAVPEVGNCYLAFISPEPFNPTAEKAERVPCEEQHTLETIAAGELTTAPPQMSSDEARQLYRECEQAALEYLGVPWRSTYTWLVLSVPSRAAWDEGAHWYRCDLMINRGFHQTRPDRTTGLIRDTATPMTCLTGHTRDGRFQNIQPSECNEPHDGEVAGVLPAPEDVTDPDARRQRIQEECRGTVREFLGVATLPSDLTFWYTSPRADALEQWVVCVVGPRDYSRSVTASLRGIGSGPIPFA